MWIFFFLALLFFGGPALAQDSTSTSLTEVPSPTLDQMDPAVRAQLQQQRDLLDTLLSTPETSAEDLSDAFALLGRLYQAYELRDAAGVCYENALRLAAKDPETLYLLALIRVEAGRFEDAAEILEEVTQARPEDFAAWMRLGEARLQTALAASDDKEALLEKARTAFLRAREIDPTSGAPAFGLGRSAAAADDPAAALPFFREALDRDPAADAVRYPLAIALRELGRIEEARAELALRGKRRPSFRDPLFDSLRDFSQGAAADLLRATRTLRRGDPQRAAELFRRALQADPSNLQALLGLAGALERSTDPRAALEPYQRALQLQPENALVHFQLAGLFARLGAPDQAVRALERTLQLAPNFRDAHYNLGIERMRGGESEKAAGHFARVVELAPDDVEARRQLARALGQMRRFEEAAKHYEVLARRPDAASEDHVGRVMAWALGERCPDALRALQESLEQRPTDPSLLQLRPRLAATCGD